MELGYKYKICVSKNYAWRLATNTKFQHSFSKIMPTMLKKHIDMMCECKNVGKTGTGKMAQNVVFLKNKPTRS